MDDLVDHAMLELKLGALGAGRQLLLGDLLDDAWPSEADEGTRLGQHDVALEPGHLVLAGSFTRVVFAQKGDTLHADFGPLGGIAVQFV